LKQKVQTNDYKLSDCWLTYDDGNTIEFHTDFFDSVEEGMLNFDLFKSKIENLIAHYLIDKNNRGNNWSKRSDELIDEIVSKI